MNRKHVLVICRKELLDILRDRRTLFVMMVLPVLLYPTLVIGLTWVSASQLAALRQAKVRVVVEGREHAPALVERLAAEENHIELVDPAALGRSSPGSGGGEPTPPGGGESAGDDPPPRAPDAAAPPEGEQPPVPDPERERLRAQWGERISEDQAEAVLLLPERFEARIAAGESVGARVLFNEGIDASVEARRRIERVVAAYREDVVAARLAARKIEPALLEPVALATVDLGGGGIVQIGRALAMLLVILSITGAFYPAIDTGAGEKERGTLETLLVSPAARMDVAVAKYLAVCVIALATITLNLVSMGLTVSHFASALPGEGSVQIDSSVVLAIVTTIVPLVLLFVALALALSTQARSVKEANNYLTPLMIAATVPAMAPLVPGLQLSFGICLVPVAGTSLLIKELLAGTADLLHVVVIFVANAIFAGIALSWVAKLYDREEVLLRLPSGGEPPPRTSRTSARLPAMLGGAGDPPSHEAWELDSAVLPAFAPDAFARARARPEEVERFIETALRFRRPLGLDASHGLLLALSVLAVTFYALPWIQPLLPEALGLPGNLAIVTVLITIGPLAAALALCRVEQPRAVLGLRAPPPLLWLAAAVLVPGTIVVTSVLTRLVADWLGLVDDEQAAAAVIEGMKQTPLLVAVICMGLVPAVCEELVYRGFVLRALAGTFGLLIAIVVTALLFGINHMNPIKLAPTTMIGLLLGLLVVRSAGSIGPSILLHAAVNGSVVVLVRHEWVGERLGLPTGEAPMPVAWIAISILSLGGGLALAWWAGREATLPVVAAPVAGAQPGDLAPAEPRPAGPPPAGPSATGPSPEPSPSA